MKAINYKILRYSLNDSLERAVRDHLAEGWQPLGGIAIDSFSMLQAMVKYEAPCEPGSNLARAHAAQVDSLLGKGAARE